MYEAVLLLSNGLTGNMIDMAKRLATRPQRHFGAQSAILALSSRGRGEKSNKKTSPK
jgi:hypothetical protein